MQNETRCIWKTSCPKSKLYIGRFRFIYLIPYLGLLDDGIAKDTNKITPILWFVPRNLLWKSFHHIYPLTSKRFNKLPRGSNKKNRENFSLVSLFRGYFPVSFMRNDFTSFTPFSDARFLLHRSRAKLKKRKKKNLTKEFTTENLHEVTYAIEEFICI